GQEARLAWPKGDAEQLPWAASGYYPSPVAFGLGTVPDPDRALAAMPRVLRPGGRLLVLGCSKPTPPWFARLYDQYSFQVLPRLGRLVAGDSDSYRYLAESIRMHPDQETLRAMMAAAGLEQCHYRHLTRR